MAYIEPKKKKLNKIRKEIKKTKGRPSKIKIEIPSESEGEEQLSEDNDNDNDNENSDNENSDKEEGEEEGDGDSNQMDTENAGENNIDNKDLKPSIKKTPAKRGRKKRTGSE